MVRHNRIVPCSKSVSKSLMVGGFVCVLLLLFFFVFFGGRGFV